MHDFSKIAIPGSNPGRDTTYYLLLKVLLLKSIMSHDLRAKLELESIQKELEPDA